jgi:hypothetical protein
MALERFFPWLLISSIKWTLDGSPFFSTAFNEEMLKKKSSNSIVALSLVLYY